MFRLNTYLLRGDTVLNEASKLFLVRILILLYQETHVFRHIQAQNVFAVDLCVELFALRIIARETFGARKKTDALQLIQEPQPAFTNELGKKEKRNIQAS